METIVKGQKISKGMSSHATFPKERPKIVLQNLQ
jgi:hypothetical protein